jgi:phospholipid-binding lipoprotein MlaA
LLKYIILFFSCKPVKFSNLGILRKVILKRFFVVCILMPFFISAASVVAPKPAPNILQEEKYPEAEKKAMVHKSLKKFAKKKHKELIVVKQPDPYDDYMTGAPAIQDPLEKFNRVIYTFNAVLDMLILEPLAYMYRDALPQMAQTGVANVIFNAFSPLYAVNHLFQADMDAFFKTTGAFVVNTLFGGLGLFDMAEGMGLKRKMNSFDQTLARWGMESGPYLILPFFGSSSFRGLYGLAGDTMLDPMAFVVANKSRSHNHHYQQKNIYLAVWGISIVEKRAQIIPFIEDVKKNSIDSYVAIRSAYDQRRIAMEEEVQ